MALLLRDSPDMVQMLEATTLILLEQKPFSRGATLNWCRNKQTRPTVISFQAAGVESSFHSSDFDTHAWARHSPPFQLQWISLRWCLVEPICLIWQLSAQIWNRMAEALIPLHSSRCVAGNFSFIAKLRGSFGQLSKC